MANRYDNAKQNQIGKVGEKVVTELLKEKSKVVHIEDVSGSTEYQDEDVDLLVHMNFDGKHKIRKVEVKTEPMAARTGNFFVEKQIRYMKDVYDENGNLLYEKGQIRQGWLLASQADWFFWYIEKHKKVYACSAKVLRKYVKRYNPRVRQRNDGYKIIDGYLVPIEDFCKKCKIEIFEVE